MAVQQHVLNWLYSILTSEYQDVNRTYNDVSQALAHFPSLSPRTDVHTFADGSSALLLHLSGTLPAVFRGATYRYPVSFWVPHAYPHEAPLVYVTPTDSMMVRPGQHVDPQGQVYHPYLAGWSEFWDKSTIVDFLTILRDVFAKEPPVISRPALRQQQQQPPPRSPASPRHLSLIPPVPQELASTSHSPHFSTNILSTVTRPPPVPTSPQPPTPPPKGASPTGVTHASNLSPGASTNNTPSPRPMPPHPHPKTMQNAIGEALQKTTLPPTVQLHPLASAAGYHNSWHDPLQQQARPPLNLDTSTTGAQQGVPPIHKSNRPPYQQSPLGQLPMSSGAQQVYALYEQQQQRPPSRICYQADVSYSQQQPPQQQPKLQSLQPSWQQVQAYQSYPQQQTPPSLPPQQQHYLQGQLMQSQVHSQSRPRALPPSDLMDEPDTTTTPPQTQTSDDHSSQQLRQTPGGDKKPPPVPPNPEKDALLHQLARTLAEMRQRSRSQNEAVLASLQAQRVALNDTSSRLQQDMAGLAQLSSMLTANTAMLHEALADADTVIGTSTTRPPPAVDDLLVGPTVVANQLYDLVAEERALADAIFMLGRAVEHGRVAPTVFVKMTRSLAREWYLKKALVRKVARGMGLALA